MRRWFATLAGLVVALTIHAPARAAEPLRLTVGTVGTIGALDPRTGSSEIAREVWNLQYPTLVTRNPKTLDPAPGLAVAWSPAPDGHAWVYTLRGGLRWSDGKPVTADDVVASVERVGGSARALENGRIEIAGDAPGALVNVAPRHVLDTTPDLDENLRALGVGVGTWHVTARTDDSVRLDALGDRPAVRQIVFRTYPSADSLVSALERGEVDVVSGLPHAEVERLGALSGVTVNHAPDGTQYLLQDDLADERARRAISLAVDRTDLVTKTVDGIGTPGVVPIVAPGKAFAPDDAVQQRLGASLDAQPVRARELLAAADLPDRPLRLSAPDDPTSRRVADYLVRALDEVGVRSEVFDGDTGDLRLVRSTIAGGPRIGRLRVPSTPASYPELLARWHERIENVAGSGQLVGLFQPDTLQAFRSDNVIGWLRTPQIRSLVVFAPTITQYSQLLAAPPPPGEEASTSTYVVGAIAVLTVCAAAFAVAAWIRRRTIT